MKKSSRYLLGLHIVAFLLWAAFFIFAKFTTRGCSAGSCGDVGFVLVPFVLPPFLVTAGALVTDITLLVKRWAPARYKSRAAWLTPTLIIGPILLWLVVESLVSFRHTNYSTDKAIAVIKNCQAHALGGYGSHPYIYLKTSPYSSILVSGGNSAREALTEAARDSAKACNYDLSMFALPVN